MKMGRIKPLYNDIQLNVAITSDNHLDISTKTNKNRMKIIRRTLKDCEKSAYPMDAYITVGDTTSKGLTENWECVKKCFEGRKPAKETVFTLGNHDTWDENKYEGYSNAIPNYYKYCKEICSLDISKPYFAKIINGYYFIFLGSTEVPENEDCASFNEYELLWLKSKLDSASKLGKPIFIFCHQSINGNHGLPRTWEEKESDWEPEIGGIGKDSDAVKEIISGYKNIYYFSGHSHMGLCGENSVKTVGYASFEQHDGVNFVNLPCLTRPCHHGENNKTGFGCILEVYKDKVVIRPRRFETKTMNRKVKIKDGKPYFEEKIV